MNARTEVDRHVDQDQQWSPKVRMDRSEDGTGLAEAPLAMTKPCGGETAEERRLSVDPMRATDRYRLVVPYTLRV